MSPSQPPYNPAPTYSGHYATYMNYEIHNGDCLEVMRAMDESSVDAIVTDPPYGLSFMGKGWDHAVPGVEFWAEALRVAKPGAHMLAFGGTRLYHRLTCAIEDAGWEVRDCLMWLYGSGFPKSHDVSKAIDKRGGYPHLAAKIGEALKSARELRGLTASECDRRFCGGTTNWSWFEGRPSGQRAPTPETFTAIAAEWREVAHLAETVAEAEREVVGLDTKARSTSGKSALPTMGGETVYQTWDITAPATDAAKRWQGWGTALKPAWEPIILARKPLAGTVASNVLEHGTGAINVDGCRVGDDGGTRRDGKADKPNDSGWENMRGHGVAELNAGRWPANLLLDGSDEVLAGFPQGSYNKPVVWQSDGDGADGTRAFGKGVGKRAAGTVRGAYGDSGSASRFFYCAKASKADRDEGLEDLEEDSRRMFASGGRTMRDGVWVETNSEPKPRRNTHPTVKPTDLMRYLCRLVTPPGAKILDPFMGSGSTGKAATLEGFHFIGIDLDPDYCDIARRRIEHASAEAGLYTATA